MGFPLVEDTHTHERIEEYFRNNIYKVIPDNNWKQAIVPAGCIVLDNDNGTAPGLILEKYGKSAILLPGPPNGAVSAVHESGISVSAEAAAGGDPLPDGEDLWCGESQVEDKILDLIDKQQNPTIATYAKTGEVHIRVTAKAATEEDAKKLGEAGGKRNQKPFRGLCLLYEGRGDAGAGCGQAVKEIRTDGDDCGVLHRWTAGWPHHQCAGSFEVYNEGFITYSNKAKRKYLDVSKSTLKKYGAVSEQTAREMATGGVFATDSDACVAVTGLAGPDGGSEEKPVGLVYIATYMKDKVNVQKYQFKGNRAKIREQAVVKGLDLLRRSILDNYR